MSDLLTKNGVSFNGEHLKTCSANASVDVVSSVLRRVAKTHTHCCRKVRNFCELSA